jgi:hypothetical protein
MNISEFNVLDFIINLCFNYKWISIYVGYKRLSISVLLHNVFPNICLDSVVCSLFMHLSLYIMHNSAECLLCLLICLSTRNNLNMATQIFMKFDTEHFFLRKLWAISNFVQVSFNGHFTWRSAYVSTLYQALLTK